MTISKLKLGVVSAVIVAGLATPLVLEQRANAKLREENLALRQKSVSTAPLAGERPAEAATDAAELERLRKEHFELLKLRGEVGRLRSAEQELAKLKAGNSRGPNAAALAIPSADVQELPKDRWSDAGFATPLAALQTRGWAVLNAHRERFKDSVHLTDGAKKLLDAMLEGMITASPDPAKARQQIREQGLSLEDAVLFPMMAENQAKGYTGYRVLSQQSPSASAMVLEVETQMTAAPAKKETLKMQQIDGAWKVVIDEMTVQVELAKGKK